MSFFDSGLQILIILLTTSLALCFVRLYLGPDIPNRTVAFDLIAIHAVAIIALFAIQQRAAPLLDITIITGVLGFLGTMMMARYLEHSHRKE